MAHNRRPLVEPGQASSRRSPRRFVASGFLSPATADWVAQAANGAIKKINNPPKVQDDLVGHVSNLPENLYGRLETCPTTRPPVSILGFWRVVEKNRS